LSSPSADYLVDRRRLRAQLSRWRVLAFVAFAIAVIAIGLRIAGFEGPGAGSAHIARLRITGLITGDDATVKLIREIGDSKAAAVLLTIDSPGGTTTGAEILYDELRRLAAKKPVVAVVNTVAASGAYIAALGADRIFVHGNTIVGSIGVLVEFPNFSGLLDKIGVKFETIKSAPLKAAPNGLEPTSAEARAAMASMVDDSYAWFKDLVKTRRAMSDDELAKVDDGRVFTGRQSLPLKLADAIGGEREAITWLETSKGVPKGLPVRNWAPEKSLWRFGLPGFAAALADLVNLPEFAQAIRASDGFERESALDGIVSIWKVRNGE
jgi:protease-4